MATSVKVPKEVMELFYEHIACRFLSDEHRRNWFPSLKAIYYQQKAVKANNLAWRALAAAHPVVDPTDWSIDMYTGVAGKYEDPKAPKKTRASRKPKAPAVPATTAPAGKQGEVK